MQGGLIWFAPALIVRDTLGMEAGNRLVESPDISVCARKHHTALECSHDVKCSRFCFGATDPLCQIINAPTEKGSYFLDDLGRQNARLGAKHAAEAQPSIPL